MTNARKPTEPWRVAVVDALQQNNKIEAVIRYRQATGAGLADARVFVKQLQRTLESGVLPEPPPQVELADAVAQLLQTGQYIPAVAMYRKAAGTDLKSAKEAVDEIARTRGISRPKSGCLAIAGWFAFLGTGGLVAVFARIL